MARGGATAAGSRRARGSHEPTEAAARPAKLARVEEVAPPATIDFVTTSPLAAPAPDVWASRAFSEAAAQRRPAAARACRLLGTARLVLRATPGHSLTAALQALCKPVRGTDRKAPPRWGGRSGARECFNRVGEPAHDGSTIPVTRMHAALMDGQVECSDDELVHSCCALVVPQKKVLWECPLLRVVIPAPAMPSNESKELEEVALSVRVYVSVLAGGLIADPDLRVLLDRTRLAPAAAATRVASLPDHPRTWTTAEVPQAELFTLPGLLRSCECAGYRAEPQPAGGLGGLQLFEFQKQTLARMADLESLPGGLNALFWERREWSDGGTFWAAPMLGELRFEAQLPQVHGGLLAEEMGLGKTIELAALVQRDKDTGYPHLAAEHRAADETAKAAARAGEHKILARTSATLVIAPAALASQWQRELRRCGLAVQMFDGEARELWHQEVREAKKAREAAKRRGEVVAKAESRIERAARLAAALSQADVVVSSYSVLTDEARKGDTSVIARMAWRRICLDECQEIRSSTTRLAALCERLHARRRWIVSGTPLYDSIDDLNGELSFLGVWPFALRNNIDGFFKERVSEPYGRGEMAAVSLVRALLSRVCIRHSKAQCCVRSGAPLHGLTGRVREARAVIQSPSESYVLRSIEALVAQLHADDAGAGAAAPRDAPSPETCALLLRLAASFAPSAERNDVLGRVDALARHAQLAACSSIASGSGARSGAVADSQGLLVLNPQDALTTLMQMTEVGTADDFVRMDDNRQGRYAVARQRAMPTVAERQATAATESEQLQRQLGALAGDVPRLRWQWAVEAVTSGMALVSLARQPAAAIVAAGVRAIWADADACARAAEDAERNARGDAKAKAKAKEQLAAAKARRSAAAGGTGEPRLFRGAVARARGPMRAHLARELREELRRSLEQRRRAEVTLGALRRYQQRLSIARNSLGEQAILSHSVQQDGLGSIQALMEDGVEAVSCMICLAPLSEPAVTRCAHLACAGCLISYLDVASARSPGAAAKAPCPLCRRPYDRDSLVVIDVSERDKEEEEKACKGSRDAAGEAPAVDASAGPRWFPIASVDSLRPAPRAPTEPRRSQRYPSLSPLLLAHYYGGTAAAANKGVPASKLDALMEIVSAAADEKVVVFSQFAETVKALAGALAARGVPCAELRAGVGPAERATAVARFGREVFDDGARVFCLQASAAAAGLTLTAARRMVLFEPFVSAGAEAQAVSRCHRIGQTRQVQITTLFAAGTIEERMVAAGAASTGREADPDGGGDNGSLTVLPGGSSSRDDTSGGTAVRQLLGLCRPAGGRQGTA